MKKYLIFVFILLLLAGCGKGEKTKGDEVEDTKLETKPFSELYKADFDGVTKIEIFNMRSGYKKITEDKELIDTFLNDIKDIKFIPQENQEDREGGSQYAITLFHNQEGSFQFGITVVNGVYYETDPDILPIVEELFNKLK